MTHGFAVLRFARATGDLHSLSSADIKLIALAHTLELLRHGDSALHALPEATAVHKGTGPADRQLPGWNTTGGTWTDMDKLAEEEILEAELKLAGNTIGDSQDCTPQPNTSLLCYNFRRCSEHLV